MIASEENVMAALSYLNDAEIAADVRYHATMTENDAKKIFSDLFLSYVAEGSVAAREAKATCSPEYQEALAKEAEAARNLERHRAKVRAAEMVVEIWRTENANARAAERVR